MHGIRGKEILCGLGLLERKEPHGGVTRNTAETEGRVCKVQGLYPGRNLCFVLQSKGTLGKKKFLRQILCTCVSEDRTSQHRVWQI